MAWYFTWKVRGKYGRLRAYKEHRRHERWKSHGRS